MAQLRRGQPQEISQAFMQALQSIQEAIRQREQQNQFQGVMQGADLTGNQGALYNTLPALISQGNPYAARYLQGQQVVQELTQPDLMTIPAGATLANKKTGQIYGTAPAKPNLPEGFAHLTPAQQAKIFNETYGKNLTEKDFTPQQTPTELAKYQGELADIKTTNPKDPRIPQYEAKIKHLIEGTMMGTGGFATLPVDTKDTWFETYRVSGKMPPFAYRDSASRNAFTSGYAEYLKRQGITPTEAVTNKVEMDALGGSLKFQQKSYGMMGGFINNLDAQINRVKQISNDTIKRVGVRALDLPIRELNTRFVGSGQEKVLQSYLMEISREIGKLSTGSQASIAELSVEAQKKWDSIHDPNLSLRELEIILNATHDQADLRRQSALQELGTTKQRMQEITTGKKKEVDDPLGIRGR